MTESKPSSTPSSKPSSIKSSDGVKRSPGLRPQDADGSSPAGSDYGKPSEKSSVKDRLTRMFSSKEPSRAATPNVAANGATNGNGEAFGRPRGSSVNSTSASKTAKDVTAADKPIDKDKAAQGQVKSVAPKEGSTRFMPTLDAPGGHEHFLKSSRRQEKLSDMWRSLIGKKAEPTPDSDLSLVSNWVDSLRQEREDAANGTKPGIHTTTTTLVEKYGKCQEIVGRGAFGIVRISHKKLGAGEKLFAVKEFRRRPEETEKKYSKRLTAEFCISSSLRHPNVIHTLDLLKDAKGDYCEVMEFCAGGDLYTLILSSGKLEVQEADCFFKQMMRGVEYLHEMGVAHRDLKPENLLLTTRGGLKITDFGNGECFRMAWETDAHMVSGLCGSAPYIAPEEYTDKEFDARAVDVWGCGVIYMAMRTGRHLWRVAKKDDDEFYARYLEGRRDEDGYGPIESLHRARCRNVIYSVLDPHPTRRLTAAQVLKSEWVREVKLCKAGEEGL
ncbi:serine/threonine-protein kinase hal4 [Cordyceps militaris CM01]|uniref:non-specific serine/threonine protein kinase n=1 Tax=Cordyceps militaris (strain CM01) TaxID=983644 RepID=G3JBD1_CORMM|nr:serine/threonine-protein kinase hal4 [Cordyceps militaris CM01]EGX94438.1 serine/threonine-protein kinase hal4 [Cordyceps militaris CM01]